MSADLRPTFEGADALMANRNLSGCEVRAAWLLWRNQQFQWTSGGFSSKRGKWHGRAWLRGAIQAQMQVSERQASRILASLIEKGVIERRAGRFFFVPPKTDAS